LIGVGGLLLPVPLRIFGAAAAVLSRVWTAREKSIALVVPPLLRLAGPVGAGYLAWQLLRAVGARGVRLTRARARER
jgi:hypothetical protein